MTGGPTPRASAHPAGAESPTSRDPRRGRRERATLSVATRARAAVATAYAAGALGATVARALAATATAVRAFIATAACAACAVAAPALALTIVGLAAPAPAVAQQPIPQQQEPPVDSAALRVRQRLEALGRPPGIQPQDTMMTDSMRLAAQARDRGRGLAAPSGDSILAALRELEGYTIMSYEGVRADYEAGSGELVLRGDSTRPVGLRQPDGTTLGADSIIRYNQHTRTGEALGSPTATPATGDPVTARRFVFDASGERASAFGARTRYQQGGGTNWNVTGDLPLVSENRIYGDHTRFTSCELEEPHYHFETDQLKIVRGNILVARPVKLYFADVPVAWLPFIAQSMSTGRASGLLTPRFSVNDIVRTNGGYQRRISNIGFYWAMSDYTDATLAFDWFSNNYTALTGSLRYNWLRQFLNGSFNARQYWSDSQSNQFALDTQNRWTISERTKFDMSVRYATSTSFVRRNSFDPREVTGQIRSQGGLQHRFDWGSLNVSADRSQSLSDDRVDMNLPRLGLTISPVTFLKAPPNRASWYNNVTWSGGFNMSRRIADRAEPADTVPFSFSQLDQADVDARATSSLNVGSFSFSQNLSFKEGIVRGVPRDSLGFFPDRVAERGMRAFDGLYGDEALAAVQGRQVDQAVDIGTADLDWGLSLDYQQNLIGTTTFTPSLSLSGTYRQIDTLDVAQSFVAGPTRVSFGANLKADAYGFYPGVGNFSAIRHKLSPTFSFDWAPEVEPTDVQRLVFGSRTLQPQSVVTVGLNQTWEAKRKPREETAAEAGAGAAPGEAGEAEGAARGARAGEAGEAPPAGEEEDPVGVDDFPAGDPSFADDGPRRQEQGEIVNFLALRTSAVRYDFVQADSTGEFLSGFQSTTLQNQISSDFLPGLTISMSHDLFEDVLAGEGGEGVPASPTRKFAPHLRSMNFGFGLNPQSAIFALVPFLGKGEDAREATPDTRDETADDPFPQRSATDETSIIPGQGTDPDRRQDGAPMRAGRGAGDWSANFSYSLTRPRNRDASSTSQLLQINLNMNPTAQWETSWATSYDLEGGGFSDHRLRLTRDLHRWQAHFDFLKTATGNWTFRFEVSLLDNQDLKFDYEQRSIDGFDTRPRPPPR